MKNELFSEKLKFLRKNSGNTQETLAEAIGEKRTTIANYETGVIYPSIDVLIKLAKYFNVSSDFLLGIDKNENPKDVDGITLNNEEIELLKLYRNNKKSIKKCVRIILGSGEDDFLEDEEEKHKNHKNKQNEK